MITIDGIEYNLKCRIERKIDIKESDISGMTLDGSIFRDIIGTFYGYVVRLEMPLKNRDRYGALIEQLTEPVDGHAFVLPDNTSTIQITGKVESPEDVWVRLESGYTYWDGLRFTIQPNAPTKELTLSEVITRGMTPFPEISSPQIGATYTYTANGWQAVADVDNTAF